jgi:hypothetical protein
LLSALLLQDHLLETNLCDQLLYHTLLPAWLLWLQLL